MPTVDAFGGGSYAPPPYDTGGAAASDAFAPYVNGAGAASNVDPDILPEVILLSTSPDPLVLGSPMSVIGINMDMVQAMYVGGVSIPWAYVSPTQVSLLPTSPITGLQEIYAESV